MPSYWLLEASCDGKKWVTIDLLTNINNWNVNETIKFDTFLNKVKKKESGGSKIIVLNLSQEFFKTVIFYGYMKLMYLINKINNFRL